MPTRDSAYTCRQVTIPPRPDSGRHFCFTVALADRQSTALVEHIDRLRAAYRRVQRMHPFQTLAVCILPDHLHAIWSLPEGDANYPLRWSLIKARFSRNLQPSETRSSSKVARREKGIWQRRYWEHQIRDDADMERHVDYLHANPLKHGLVSKLVDWPYSSFHKYVADGLLPNDWAGWVPDECGFGE